MANKPETLKILNYFVIIFIQKKGKSMKVKELIETLKDFELKFGNIDVIMQFADESDEVMEVSSDSYYNHLTKEKETCIVIS